VTDPGGRRGELLGHVRNKHSQFGEDGVIARIFDVVGTTTRVCCEFGAWDGYHLSNTRALIDEGWRAVLIEADPERCAAIEARREAGVVAIQAIVDDDRSSLDRLLAEAGVTEELDFLSIDIDGADYYIFRSLRVRPRVICVEVPGGQPPVGPEVPREIAMRDVGQPMSLFVEAARKLGYRLIGYTSNAFFLRNDVSGFPEITPTEAYEQRLAILDRASRDWLWLTNQALVHPHYRFNNPYLERTRLGISRTDAVWLALRARLGRM
jgi:hypothetical protein